MQSYFYFWGIYTRCLWETRQKSMQLLLLPLWSIQYALLSAMACHLKINGQANAWISSTKSVNEWAARKYAFLARPVMQRTHCQQTVAENRETEIVSKQRKNGSEFPKCQYSKAKKLWLASWWGKIGRNNQD